MLMLPPEIQSILTAFLMAFPYHFPFSHNSLFHTKSLTTSSSSPLKLVVAARAFAPKTTGKLAFEDLLLRCAKPAPKRQNPDAALNKTELERLEFNEEASLPGFKVFPCYKSTCRGRVVGPKRREDGLEEIHE